MTRQPVVAGRFYPGDPAVLAKYLDQVMPAGTPKRKALGLVSPHAGYIYSGAAAGTVISAALITPTVIMLGPNHTGRGTPASIMSQGAWRTPLGDAAIDEELAETLKKKCPLLREDATAHEHEHSLEVQLPFLQHINPAVKIVPICLMLRNHDHMALLGKAIGTAVKEKGGNILILASSDMTHYEHAEIARHKDSIAIKRILALDPEGLYRVVCQEQITMCGVVPATVMLHAALEQGAVKAENIVYTNSGLVSGDYASVVGYAGVLVE